MDGVTRIGVSLEPELLKEFDEAISKKEYASRSEAIRDLVRDSLAENEWKNKNHYMTGTIIVIYDQNTNGVTERLSTVKHRNKKNISVSLQSDLGNDKTVDLVVVNGKLKELKELSNEIASVKGVLKGKLTMAAPSACKTYHIDQKE
jgi:CopG family nickel-responsive transcriptional regulator